MAARPTWKGFLKVSLVTIPVKVFPATESAASLSFNQLHAECQTRIQQKRWCPHCEREVASADLVKGYEFEKGRYVVVGEEDVAKVRVESTRVINLMQFADEAEIDPIYVDRSYYLAPDGPVAAEAFAVMREGMTGKAGIGKVALYGREYVVAVRPQQRGLVMYTLHHDAEIRSIDQIDERVREAAGMHAEIALRRQRRRNRVRQGADAVLHRRADRGEARGNGVGSPGCADVRRSTRSQELQGRVSGRTTRDHRRKDRW